MWVDGRVNGWMSGWKCRRVGGWMDRQKNGQLGWVGGWTDKCALPGLPVLPRYSSTDVFSDIKCSLTPACNYIWTVPSGCFEECSIHIDQVSECNY